MTDRFPPVPPVGKELLLNRPSAQARDLLALRRSAGSRMLTHPGPEPDEVTELLRIAARVPDHRKLEPWRFIVFEGEARARFGQIIERVYAANTPDATPAQKAEERARPARSPVIIGVVSSPDKAHKTPVWEQELSAGALCFNLLLAANASGWAGVWLTEWVAFDRDIAKALNLTDDERMAGFIYLGTSTCNSPERPRPDMDKKITRF